MNKTTKLMAPPVIGMLAWEGGGEGSLNQLEVLPGNILHPDTFAFTFKLSRIRGANYRTVVEQPSQEVLAGMIAAAREMEQGGIKAITTSCGFNAVFQKELACAVAIPVFSSSLLQVPMVHCMLRQGQQIGVITADRRHLTRAHLENAGIASHIPVCIGGMEDTGEFSRVRQDPRAELDGEKFIHEVVDVARMLASENRDLGAIVLECTDLPPAAAAIRATLGVPVFDIVTLTNMVYASVAGTGWNHAASS